MQENTAGASGETQGARDSGAATSSGRRRRRRRRGPAPPLPSPAVLPLPSPPPKPDFTPPPARARRNSHFVAADPAPTTAAATVTSRRCAAGPAPPQRPGRPASSGGVEPPSSCAAPWSSVTVLSRFTLPSSPTNPRPAGPPAKARAHEAPPFRDIPLIAKLWRSGALRVWGGLSLHERRGFGFSAPKTQSTRPTRCVQPRPRGHRRVSLLEFPFLGFARDRCGSDVSGPRGHRPPRYVTASPPAGSGWALPWQVRPQGRPRRRGQERSRERGRGEGARGGGGGNTKTEKEEVRVCTGKYEKGRMKMRSQRGKGDCVPFYQKCFRFLALISRRQEKITLDVVCKLQVHFVTFSPNHQSFSAATLCFKCIPASGTSACTSFPLLAKLLIWLCFQVTQASTSVLCPANHWQGGRSLKVLHSQYR